MSSGLKFILFLIFSVSFLSGCATVSERGISRRATIADGIDLDSFCKKHNFEYTLDTIDDIVKIYSLDKEIKILLNSSVGRSKGALFSLKSAPIYYKGKIILPRQLEEIIFSKKFISLKSLLDVNTVVIDPGHGGKDPGAISPQGLKEKELNLIVAKYLKTELERQGFKVVLTRSRDEFISLSERVMIAKTHNADLFLSIHANSNRSNKVNGAEIYYLYPSRLDSNSRALKLAKSEGFQGKNIPFDVNAILWDLLITKNHALSIELSNILHFNFKRLGFKVKPPKRAPFYVLRFAYVPSVLIEMGYLSNPQEARILYRKHYQKQIVEAIALSVSSLKRHYLDFAKSKEYDE